VQAVDPDTTGGRLSPPEPFEIVSASEVREIIEATDRELSELETRAADATTAADAAERRARDADADNATATWAMVRLQHFLDNLRAENARDIEIILDVADQRARLRRDEARAEVERIRERALAVTPEPELSREPALLDTHEPPRPETVVVAAPLPPPPPEADLRPDVESEPPAPEPEPVETLDPGQIAAYAPPTVPLPSSGNGSTPEHVLTTTALADPLSTDVWAKPAVATVGALAVPAPAAAPAVPAEAPAPAPAQVPDATQALDGSAPASPSTEQEFWPQQAEPAAKKRSFLKRIPVSAVLEVLAVILILVFILLRLS
jgi:hypothetical protein